MEQWLQCTICEGQFTGEYAVQGETFDGTEFSLFVPDEFVELSDPLDPTAGAAGWIRVEVLDQRGDLVLVQLPRQTLENGRSLTVRRDQLQCQPVRQEA